MFGPFELCANRSRSQEALDLLAWGSPDMPQAIDDEPLRHNSLGGLLHPRCEHGEETWCRHCDGPDPWECER